MNNAMKTLARADPDYHGTRASMNSTEARYAQQLELRKAAGEILDYQFEAVKLRLGKKTWYTPDFMVILHDGTLEMHEVKGRKGKKYYCRDDAKVKIKVAADIFPFRFFIVWQDKHGGFSREDF